MVLELAQVSVLPFQINISSRILGGRRRWRSPAIGSIDGVRPQDAIPEAMTVYYLHGASSSVETRALQGAVFRSTISLVAI